MDGATELFKLGMPGGVIMKRSRRCSEAFKCNFFLLVHYILRCQYVLQRGNGSRVFAAIIITSRKY